MSPAKPSVRALAPTFASVAEVWRGRSQSHNILALAASLGPRIEAAPQLLDIVESLTADPRRPVAEAALAHLSRMRDRSRFLALAPKLFGEDPGWVLCRVMEDYLDRRRQDLLAGVLRPRLVRRAVLQRRYPAAADVFRLPLLDRAPAGDLRRIRW